MQLLFRYLTRSIHIANSFQFISHLGHLMEMCSKQTIWLNLCMQFMANCPSNTKSLGSAGTSAELIN